MSGDERKQLASLGRGEFNDTAAPRGATPARRARCRIGAGSGAIYITRRQHSSLMKLARLDAGLFFLRCSRMAGRNGLVGSRHARSLLAAPILG